MGTTILLLDDDKRMFNAINRLLRPLDAALLSTASPARGLEFCRDYEVQMIIADLNRKDIDLANFLRSATEVNQHTRKIVLTSYAELDSTVAAINEGKIHRYFTSPWEPDDLRNAIIEELNDYLEDKKKSSEMKSLGARTEEMEEKVNFTTRLLNGTTELLASSRIRASISVCTKLLEYRLPGSQRYAKKTAKTAAAIAAYLDLDEREQEEVSLAAELHLVGLLSMPDKLLKKPFEAMSLDEQTLFCQFPAIGAEVIQGDENPHIAEIVRHHREDNDGNGYPDQLVAHYIPIGSRIIRVAADYESVTQELGSSVALLELLKDKAERYDPSVLEALTEIKLNPSHIPTTQRNEAMQWH